jgi:hypothetical protein
MAKKDTGKVILQSVDDYDRQWPILNEFGIEDRSISFPSKHSVGNDGIRQNVIEIDQEDYDYLIDKYKLFKEFVDKGTVRKLDAIPTNYLTVAAQVANARNDIADAQAKTAEVQKIADSKDAEIAELKKKLEGYGEKTSK